MPKRRKSTSTEKSDTSEPHIIISIKKPKRSITFDQVEIIQELYETIRNYKNEDSRLLCESFIRAPKRRTAADYYEIVSTPIDLLKIQQKLKTDEYEEIDHFTEDIRLMVNNAKSYYKKSSQEYKDATELWELYIDTKDDLIAEALGEEVSREEPEDSYIDEPENTVDEIKIESKTEEGRKKSKSEESRKKGKKRDKRKSKQRAREDLDADNEESYVQPEEAKPVDEMPHPSDIESPYEQLFAAVMTATSEDINISEPFRLLPSRLAYPDYYDIISDPMDLKMVAVKIQKNHYKNLDDMQNDLLLMVHNAKTFNEPGSFIYKYAVLLKKVISSKKQEIDQGKGTVKSSDRIRSRRSAGAQHLSAICAALNYESDLESDVTSCHDNISQMEFEDDSGGEGSIAEDKDNIQWMLFNAVRKFKNSIGQFLADPFLRLPSRRTYPDYYIEIQKPRSLSQIKKKIKAVKYPSLEALAGDFDLIFNNAQKFNSDESRLFKDAEKLRKLMRAKKVELEKLEVKEEAEEEVVVKEVKEVIPERKAGRPKGSRNRQSGAGDDMSERKKCGRKPLSYEEHLKKRLTALYDTVYDYKIEGRSLIDIFVELPSEKLYPDYYNVITNPIDMITIQRQMKESFYQNEQSLVNDLKQMFTNARIYNEEVSQVYKDSVSLEKVLKDKWKGMGHFTKTADGASNSAVKRVVDKSTAPLTEKLLILYNTVKKCMEPKTGRELAQPFLVVPSRTDYPDYYEVIKRPIDMQRIYSRMTSNNYDSLEDMVADFAQMFDNACKYNEPESLIYKDALTLQRLVLEKKCELTEEDAYDPPDVQSKVQEIMTNLFISVYNYQDEEGRCYSDSFAELATVDMPLSEDGQVVNKPRFDQVKNNLDRNRYRRLDRFQEDMFSVFEFARSVSQTDSQLYEDAVEMQMFFIKIRDELCKNGELLLTPALSYTDRHLHNALETERREKAPREQQEDDDKKEFPKKDDKMEESDADSADFQDETYHVGDFVYVGPRESGLKPHIVCIEKLWKDKDGVQWLYGGWFYRPKETFHLATRKFLEKEVFKSDSYASVELSKVMSKCFVVFVKDYFKQKPEGFEDKDVFVCESRYTTKHKSFKKIKIWQMPGNDSKLVARDIPLVPLRIASEFAESTGTDGSSPDSTESTVIDKKRQNVLQEKVLNPEDGCTYYEQYKIPAGCFKLGDYVYVRSEEERPFIAKIDRMWVDKEERAYFHGPWFVHPPEVDHPPTRLFYQKEVFMSSIEDTNPLLSITGKCCVLWVNEYCTCRPTEIAEHDIFICESKYHEGERSIRKVSKGVKKPSLSPKVTDDEIYFFRKAIQLQRVSSPHLTKAATMPAPPVPADFDEDSRDDESFIDTSFLDDISAPSTPGTPAPRQKRKRRKGTTGFIVFSADIRKRITREQPGIAFGDISKLVGGEWRNLPEQEKKKYEEKAKKISEELAAKHRASEAAITGSQMDNSGTRISPGMAVPSHHYNTQGYPQQPQQQYASTSGMPQQMGYPQGQMMQQQQQVYPQQPQQMMHPQGMQPQQAMSPQMMQGMGPGMATHQQRLPTQGYIQGMPVQMQHGMHHQQGMYPSMSPHSHHTPQTQTPSSQHPQVSVNAVMMGVPSGVSPRPPGDRASPFDGMKAPQQMQPPAAPPRPPSPMFVTVPPRTQRLAHSDAYLRYIEGLKADNPNISNWRKVINATPENTPAPPQGTRLPGHWITGGPGVHGNTVNALWALRDLMHKDTMEITRTLEFSEL